jgi:hypothetical protein
MKEAQSALNKFFLTQTQSYKSTERPTKYPFTALFWGKVLQ